MRDLKTFELTQDHQKTLLRFADNYRLSQSLDEHNKSKFDWRTMLRPFNRSRN